MSRKTYMLQEIQRWRKDGLISPAQAVALELQYSDDESSAVLSRTPATIFGSIGALAIGLGIILLIGFNWELMSKEAKLLSVFIPLILFHGFGIWSRIANKAKWISETAHLLGTMMFGAAIILVAQIYHIDDHWPNGSLAWGLGAMLFFFILQSKAHGILSAILMGTFLIGESLCFYEESTLPSLLLLTGPLWVLALFVGWSYVKKSVLMLVPSLMLFAISCGALIPVWLLPSRETLHVLPNIYCFLIPLFFYGGWYFIRNDESRKYLAITFKFFGHIFLFPLLGVLTFDMGLSAVLYSGSTNLSFVVSHPYLWSEIVTTLLLVTGGIILPIGYGILLFRRITCPLSVKINNWIPIVIFAYYMANVIAVMNNYMVTVEYYKLTGPLVDISTILFSVAFLYLLLTHIWNGCKERQLVSVVGFTLVLATWLIVRFFTWFDNFLYRGIAFLAIGVFLLLIAVLYSKMNPKKKSEA